MRYYNKILPFENTRRMAKIMTFRNQVVEYFNNCKYEMFEAIPNDQAGKLRIEINKSLDEVAEMVHAAGVSTWMLYDPAPVRGGYRGNVDVLLNIFNLAYLQIKPNVICDHLERAYGVYERNRRPAKIRFINPFFYLSRILEFIVEIPFAILGRMGFDRGKAESSLVGRIVKGIFQLVVYLAALLTALHYLGLLDGIKEAILGRG